MIVYLVGYMCSGKTTLGTLLSKFSDICFTDLDKYIEERVCDSINNIFAKIGEDGFREIEHSALRYVTENIGGIIATGGGTPCFFDNMEYMNNKGVSIYLKCSDKELLNRLKIYKSTRPLLKDKNDAELLSFIESSLPKRSPFYEKASITIDADTLATEEGCITTAHKLIEMLKL